MYALRSFYPFFYELKNYQQLLADQELFKEACSKMLLVLQVWQKTIINQHQLQIVIKEIFI